MRKPADRELIEAFTRRFGSAATENTRVYFTGGVSAVLLGWRSSTVDLDLLIVPEQDVLFRAIPKLKETLRINVELACPSDFIPELPGWQDRSRFIAREGKVSYYHYDFYSQALAKVERGHAKDLQDVDQMRQRGLIEPDRALELFDAIESELYRFPAIDAKTFRQRVEMNFGPAR